MCWATPNFWENTLTAEKKILFDQALEVFIYKHLDKNEKYMPLLSPMFFMQYYRAVVIIISIYICLQFLGYFIPVTPNMINALTVI